MVIGNHDFHLLVCALTERSPNKKDTFQDILTASDKSTLLDYLLERPLAIKHDNALLVHAGAPPQWNINDVLDEALNYDVDYCLIQSVGHIIKEAAFFTFIEKWIAKQDFFITGQKILTRRVLGVQKCPGRE